MKQVVEKFSKKSKIVELVTVNSGNYESWHVVFSDVDREISNQFDKQDAYKAFDLLKEALK